MSEIATRHGISSHRIQAMVLRYWYLLMSSWPRLLELIYWPVLQIITWGFLQAYISQNDGFFARAGGTLIGAVILWDILFRGQLGFSISFLEEMWARNIGNLMMSPLKPIEFLISLMIMSLIRLAIGVIPMTLLALFFFDLNFFAIGRLRSNSFRRLSAYLMSLTIGKCAGLFLLSSDASTSMCTIVPVSQNFSTLPVTRSSKRTPNASNRSAPGAILLATSPIFSNSPLTAQFAYAVPCIPSQRKDSG